eukprot:TRINITY_DN1800_c0_g2_i2.p1 TRINITY_DN1800_c0_g2~~TRINITY_DN1800_c0_g2_i2.p1  ORF type:complete len:482 (+),score=140.88 TRINITY_DN1800_c0_g2_i2:25-1446(+)
MTSVVATSVAGASPPPALGSRGGFTTEFHVVLLAGGTGSRMYPLVSPTALPKSMLPVANRPLVTYQLECLDAAGFRSVTVVTNPAATQQLSTVTRDLYNSKIAVDFVSHKDTLGTAEVVAKLRDRIKDHLVLMSGDVVTDPALLHVMADLHRAKDAAVTMLLCSRNKPNQTDDKSTPQDLFSPKDYIGVAADGRVVYMAATADLDDVVPVKKRALKKAGRNMELHADLYDLHVYIMNQWALDVLVAYKDRFTSIKNELLPFLIKLQSTPRVPRALTESPRPVDDASGSAGTASTATLLPHPSYDASRMSHTSTTAANMCFAVMVPHTQYSVRVNTITSYIDANKEIARGVHLYQPWEQHQKNNFISSTTDISNKTQVGADCVVGDGSVIGDRCGVKTSVIGKHCKIGDNVKIANSVIMDRVSLGEGCILTDCVVCNDAVIAPRCVLRDCRVGIAAVVEGPCDLRNENLTKETE